MKVKFACLCNQIYAELPKQLDSVKDTLLGVSTSLLSFVDSQYYEKLLTLRHGSSFPLPISAISSWSLRRVVIPRGQSIFTYPCLLTVRPSIAVVCVLRFSWSVARSRWDEPHVLCLHHGVLFRRCTGRSRWFCQGIDWSLYAVNAGSWFSRLTVVRTVFGRRGLLKFEIKP